MSGRGTEGEGGLAKVEGPSNVTLPGPEDAEVGLARASVRVVAIRLNVPTPPTDSGGRLQRQRTKEDCSEAPVSRTTFVASEDFAEVISDGEDHG